MLGIKLSIQLDISLIFNSCFVYYWSQKLLYRIKLEFVAKWCTVGLPRDWPAHGDIYFAHEYSVNTIHVMCDIYSTGNEHHYLCI